MMINRNFKDFKFHHKRKQNQILFISKKINKDKEVLNLINNFLIEKNSFVFESVEKGFIKGRYTIFGKKPDKIWEFNNNKSYTINKFNKRKYISGEPRKILESLIENFKFKTPKNLPPICSLLVGYFSYDIIRYIEKIPDKCNDDLKIPDIRLIRPKTIIIHDNLRKKLYFIINCFADQKITNYKKYYNDQLHKIKLLKSLAFNYQPSKTKQYKNKNKIIVKSNISKN